MKNYSMTYNPLHFIRLTNNPDIHSSHEHTLIVIIVNFKYNQLRHDATNISFIISIHFTFNNISHK